MMRLLSEDEADDILDGRAKLAVAQERYDTAARPLPGHADGEDSLRVQAAEAARQAGREQPGPGRTPG